MRRSTRDLLRRAFTRTQTPPTRRTPAKLGLMQLEDRSVPALTAQFSAPAYEGTERPSGQGPSGVIVAVIEGTVAAPTPVSVTLSTSAGPNPSASASDYSFPVLSQTITYLPTDTGRGVQFQWFAPIDAAEPTEYFTVSMAVSGAGIIGGSTRTVTIYDSGGTSPPGPPTSPPPPSPPVNQPPVAVADSAKVHPGQSTTINVLANDYDPNGDPISLIGVGQGGKGTVSIAGGAVTYTATSPTWTGTDSFTYTISDGRGGTATGTVTVTIGNAPPIANPDSAFVRADASATIAVLANDSDPDGDPLTITGTSTPAKGTATVVGGAVKYTPSSPTWSGTDTFTYTISDGYGGTASATVTVTIQANRPPVANPDAISARPGYPGSVNVLANDTDPDGDPLTVTGFTQGAKGKVTFAGGSATYAPTAGAWTAAGADSFTYTISDGRGGTATGTVTVNVTPNGPPVANPDSATVHSGSSVSINVLANDTDPNGDPLTITGVSQGKKGTVSISGGAVTYTSKSPTDTGTDTFTYTISDGYGGTATGTVTVTLANAPPVAKDDTATVHTGNAVTVNVLANDSDPDGDALTITGVTQGKKGTVTIAGGEVKYASSATSTAGTDTFTYTISDGHGGTASATVTVTLTNAPPVAKDDSASVHTGSSKLISVLANDSDPDGDSLTITRT